MERDSAAGRIVTETEAAASHRRRRRHERTPAEAFLDAPDPSVHMLGLPKSRPKFGSWFTIALIAGILMALLVVFITSF